MYGIGILRGLGVTMKHFVETFVDDIQYLGRKGDMKTFQHKQSLANRGLVTVEYPDEKIAVPERFRFIPFLVTYNYDDPEYAGKDWCTSCGICAKVCPPQCIWIVRGTNAETGRPKPEPEQFYIDIDVCMNCGYCAEYCPFDAIKMDHDYELASYDRTSNHIFDKHKLSKELRYWQTIAPTTAAEELVARGGYDHTDVQKNRKKAGLEASRSGPISERPSAAEATAEAVVATAAGVAQPEAVTDRPSPAAGQQSAATPQAGAGAATTADGKVIVRRRGAGPRKEGAEASATAAPAAPAAATPKPAAKAAPASSNAPAPAATEAPRKIETAPAPPSTPAAPKSEAQGGMIQRGPKRVIDPNNPPPVVRRRNPPPK
jgi:NADH-quinone oxidoreductase subunit I